MQDLQWCFHLFLALGKTGLMDLKVEQCWVICRILLLCLSAQGCTVLDENRQPIDVIYAIYVNDTQEPNVPLFTLSTDSVQGIESLTDEFVEPIFDSVSKNISLSLKTAFTHYEEVENNDKIGRTVTLNCDNGEHGSFTFTINIYDNDNHDPAFNGTRWRYELPMPYPPGLEITHENDIFAYDFDLTSDLDVELSDTVSSLLRLDVEEITEKPFWSGHDKKKFYAARLYSKVSLTQPQDLDFNLYAMDRNNPKKKATFKVTIARNEELSIPDSPILKRPLYNSSVDCEMADGTQLKVDPEDIEFEKAITGSLNVDLGGDLVDYFNYSHEGNGLKIYLKKKIDCESNDIRFALLSIIATVVNASEPGYSAIFITFPEKSEPTTTTSEPITCPVTTCIPCDTTISNWISTLSATSTIGSTPGSTCQPCSETTCTPCDCTTWVSSSLPPTSTMTDEVTTVDPSTHSATSSSSTLASPTMSQQDTTHSGQTASDTEAYETTPSRSTEENTCSCPTCPQTTCTPCDCTTWVSSSLPPTSTMTDEVTTVDPSTHSATSSSSTLASPTMSQQDTTHSGQTASDTEAYETTPSRSTEENTCSCPTCPQPTGGPPTLGPPPEDASLEFMGGSYSMSITSGDTGFIATITAEPHPGDLTKWGDIKYQLKELPDELTGCLAISSKGEIAALKSIKQGSYDFLITAEIVSITNEAKGRVTLVSKLPIELCGNDTALQVVFPTSFIMMAVEEETVTTIAEIGLPPQAKCNFQLAEEKPAKGWFYVWLDDNFQSAQVILTAVDREDPIFGGAVEPEVFARVNVTCWREGFGTLPVEGQGSEGSDEMAILVRITDKNDNRPTFSQSAMNLGYPVKEIAEVELPERLGVVTAHDNDAPENAVITYSIRDSDQVIVDANTGSLYPHPQNFKYAETTYVNVYATDGKYSNEFISVYVKPLTAPQLATLHVHGRQPEDVPTIIENLTAATGFHVRLVSARLEADELEGTTTTTTAIPPTTNASIADIAGDDRAPVNETEDGTCSLRLVAYAFNGSDLIDASLLIRSLGNMSFEGRPLVATPYVPSKISSDNNDALTAAVITVSILLGLLILGIIAYVVYRMGLIQLKRRKQGSIDEVLIPNDNHHFQENLSSVFIAEDGSRKMAGGALADGVDGMKQVQSEGPPMPERKKSVIFAEATEVIPSEDEPASNPDEEDEDYDEKM